MAGIKQTSRQKMIGMMYLVLTALLALNVSKEILDAFVFINNGLQRTNTALEQKSGATLYSITHSAEPIKRVPFERKALEVVTGSDAMLAYIEELKARIIASSVHGNKTGERFQEFLTESGNCIALDSEDDEGELRIPKIDEDQNCTSLLVGPDPEHPRNSAWSASELKSKLESFREDMKVVNVLDIMGNTHSLSGEVISGLDSVFTYGKEKERDKWVEWEAKHFYHVPLAAVITYLTKLQTDVINSKSDMLNFLSEGITGEQMVFSDVDVAVVPKQSYVLRGDSFEAEVYLTAKDIANKTKLYVGSEVNENSVPQLFDPALAGSIIESGVDGKARFRMSTNSLMLGDHGYSGMLEYMDNGEAKKIPFNFPSFTVAAPSATVSPTMMNVFYRGVENPVDVSVPGADKSTIEISCPGHKLIQQQDGQWIVKPGAANDAIVTITAVLNGQRKTMGQQTFRVKKIPTPVPYIGKKTATDRSIQRGDLQAVLSVYPKLENFDFAVNAEVISYKLQYSRNGQVIDRKCYSKTLTTDDKDWIKKIKVGEVLYVEEFNVKLPDDRVVELPMIKLNVTN